MSDRIPMVGTWRALYHDPATGRRWRGGLYRNVICANGKAVIAAWMNGENPVLGYWGALGTGAGSPMPTDTQLFTELARVPLASSSRGTNIILLDFFFNTSQGNGTLIEAGCFMSASAAINSGQLLSHVTINETKASTVTLTLEFSLQIG